MGLFIGMPSTLEQYNPDERFANFVNSETVDVKGHFHSYGDAPSVIQQQRVDEQILIWHKHGVLSRENNQPPVITVSATSYSTFNELNQLHSYNGMPSEIKYYPAPDVFELTWHKEGMFHHEEDKPALISTRKRAITTLAYYRDNKIHRANHRVASLTKHAKSYWVQGILHNSAGPAEITNKIDDRKFLTKTWSLYGVNVPEKVFTTIQSVQKEKGIPSWVAFLHTINVITHEEIALFSDEAGSWSDTFPMKWVLKSWGVTEDFYNEKVDDVQRLVMSKRKRIHTLDTLIQITEFENSEVPELEKA